MAWNASGDDRGRSYRVYRELEAVHVATLARVRELEAVIRLKDATIRSLAAELASNEGLQETLGTVLQEEPAPTPARTESGFQKAAKPSNRPLSEVLGADSKRKETR
jgi:hypothetical protein